MDNALGMESINEIIKTIVTHYPYFGLGFIILIWFLK